MHKVGIVLVLLGVVGLARADSASPPKTWVDEFRQDTVRGFGDISRFLVSLDKTLGGKLLE